MIKTIYKLFFLCYISSIQMEVMIMANNSKNPNTVEFGGYTYVREGNRLIPVNSKNVANATATTQKVDKLVREELLNKENSNTFGL